MTIQLLYSMFGNNILIAHNLLSFEEKLDEVNKLKIGFWVVRAGETGKEEKDVFDNVNIRIND